MPLRPIYKQNIGFNEQILYFWALQTGLNNKEYINWHYFCHENISLVTFSELPPIGLCQYYTKMCCSIAETNIHLFIVSSSYFKRLIVTAKRYGLAVRVSMEKESVFGSVWRTSILVSGYRGEKKIKKRSFISGVILHVNDPMTRLFLLYTCVCVSACRSVGMWGTLR